MTVLDIKAPPSAGIGKLLPTSSRGAMFALAIVVVPATAVEAQSPATETRATSASRTTINWVPDKPQSTKAWTLSAAAPADSADAARQGEPAPLPGAGTVAAADQATAPSHKERPQTTSPASSANELASQITNPVTALWSIQLEFNSYKLESDKLSPVSGKWVNNLLFQPILPVSITNDLNLITRPVIAAFQSVPYPTGPGRTGRKTAFGDTILAQLLSPAHTEPWIIAAGPTWVFPTAGSSLTGQGKWQVGPAIGAGYITSKVLAGAFVQQWWSFAGEKDREGTSQMNILPQIYAFFGDGWSVGYSGYITADWKAPRGDRWTVPVGLSVGKVVKVGILPVQIRVGGQYIPIRPEFGPRWAFQLQITPVIPRLIKKPLFQ